jgi:hypothetical protein
MLSAMSNRRTSPGSRDIGVPAQFNGHADENSDVCDCPACIAEHAAPVYFEMLIGDDDPVGDPIEAECGMGMLLTMGLATGMGYDEWRDKILADLTEAGTTQAAGMMAALASLSEGQARTDALDAIAKGPGLPEWAKELVEPLTVVRCLRLEDQEGDVWALVAEFSRGDARHAFVLATAPDEGGHAIDIVACAPDELPDCLNWVKETAGDQGYQIEEIALDPAAFREEAEAAIDERHALDTYDLDDDIDEALDEDEAFDADLFGDLDPLDNEFHDELDLEFDDELDDMSDEDLDEDLDYYTALPVLLARLRQLPEAG